MSETRAVRDERLAPLDHHVASAADDWFDNPRDAKVYGRLVAAIEARRAHLRSRSDRDGTKLGVDVSTPRMTPGGTTDETPVYDLEDARGNAAARGTKADKTRTRVLDAAAKVFSRKGYTGTRLADIAAEADMHAGSLYYHFRTREELVDEVLRVGQERVDRFVRDRVADLPPDTTNLTRLRELITAHLEMVLEFGDYTSAMIRIIGQVPEDVHQRRLHDQRQYGQYWRSLFKDAQASGELRTGVDLSAMMMIILGALNSSPGWYHPSEGPPVAALGSELGNLFLTGLASTGTPQTNAPGIPPACQRSRPESPNPGGPRREATRARILDAAATVLREHGYAGTPLSTVAAAAGLRPGSLYYYFHSREDLLATLLGEAWEQANRVVRHAVEDLPATASHIERLSAAMAAHLLSSLDHDSRTSGVLRTVEQLPEEVRHPSLDAQSSFTMYWHQLLADAKEAGEVRADIDVPSVVKALVGSSNWAIEWHQPEGRLDPRTLVTQVTTMAFHGLGAMNVRPDS
jgi:AcrR family transcriptional regulator